VKIGVVKEIKPQEARIALTPAGARELVARGHDVVVEAGAGASASSPSRVAMLRNPCRFSQAPRAALS